MSGEKNYQEFVVKSGGENEENVDEIFEELEEAQVEMGEIVVGEGGVYSGDVAEEIIVEQIENADELEVVDEIPRRRVKSGPRTLSSKVSLLASRAKKLREITGEVKPDIIGKMEVEKGKVSVRNDVYKNLSKAREEMEQALEEVLKIISVVKPEGPIKMSKIKIETKTRVDDALEDVRKAYDEFAILFAGKTVRGTFKDIFSKRIKTVRELTVKNASALNAVLATDDMNEFDDVVDEIVDTCINSDAIDVCANVKAMFDTAVIVVKNAPNDKVPHKLDKIYTLGRGTRAVEKIILKHVVRR